MQKNHQYSHNVTQKSGQLQAIIYLLQTNLDEFKDEVDRSYQIINNNSSYELYKSNDENNALNTIFRLSSNIDTQIGDIVDRMVKGFLKFNADLIYKSYRTKTSMQDLHYTIILKDDNIDNRNRIFDFFDKYDLLDFSEKYPVNFQFVPIEMIEHISIAEEITG